MPVTVKPKQSLGQNFLVDDNIARKIVREMVLTNEDIVFEIGAGQGALTSHLAQNAKHLIAVEIDGRVVAELKNKFSQNTVEILHHDFLKISLISFKNKLNQKLRLVGNIPYHLTSSILFKFFEERTAIKDATIMVQREVAKRIVAKPNTKDYGILSVFSQYYGEPKLLFNVSPTCFYPKPQVISSVLHIKIREELSPDVDDELFRVVVKTAFGKRRKTLRNSLLYLPLTEDKINKVQTLDLFLDKRPEQLTVQQFAKLTNSIERVIE
ncbi:MAG: 16S rRNA (adenine(1518)-N(6)/adenine(1519)-N(6))-dimethyltransferase RsmA [Bacteroidota bacterium]|nr:16S rRNA (adenine(1518)-N(6)/adenine(1519)-N(6))-dimethyltransferase RsmA [Bacteroidota bacterium]